MGVGDIIVIVMGVFEGELTVVLVGHYVVVIEGKVGVI